MRCSEHDTWLTLAGVRCSGHFGEIQSALSLEPVRITGSAFRDHN